MAEIIRIHMQDPFEVLGLQQAHFKEMVSEEFAWSLLNDEERKILRKGDRLIELGIRITGRRPTSETFQRIEKEYPGYASAYNAYTLNHIYMRRTIDKGDIQ